ncbi:MAG: hypothetical protein ABI131_07750 [Nostocoides sp.]
MAADPDAGTSTDPDLDPGPDPEAAETAGLGAEAGDEQSPVTPKPMVRPRPEQTRDDTDAGWGERRAESGHDRWLREQRPPHWE